MACAALRCRGATDGGVGCPGVVSPAVEVEMRDARTGAPLAAAARGQVTDGAYADSLRPARQLSADPASLVSRQAALGRPGTYAVEVARAGYAPWAATGVRPGRDACGVVTAVVRADLVAVP